MSGGVAASIRCGTRWRDGYEGKPIVVEVHADADPVSLRLNGSAIGSAPVERFRAAFDVTYEPGVLSTVALCEGVEVGHRELRTAVGEIALRAAADQLVISHGDADLAFVDIADVDAVGTVVTGHDVEVTVAVTGPGRLQGRQPACRRVLRGRPPQHVRRPGAGSGATDRAWRDRHQRYRKGSDSHSGGSGAVGLLSARRPCPAGRTPLRRTVTGGCWHLCRLGWVG
jgi:hypothetical protein